MNNAQELLGPTRSELSFVDLVYQLKDVGRSSTRKFDTETVVTVLIDDGMANTREKFHSLLAPSFGRSGCEA